MSKLCVSLLYITSKEEAAMRRRLTDRAEDLWGVRWRDVLSCGRTLMEV